MKLNKRFTKTLCMLGAVGMIAMTIKPGADVFASEKSEAQSKMSALEAEKESRQAAIAELDGLKNDAVAYIQQIDGQLTQVSTKINELVKQMKSKNKEIDVAKVELADAETSIKEQYADMKLRIQFMYENGNQEYAALLLSASDLSDFLNKAEYVSKITDYDTKMLDKMKQTKDLIVATEKQLETDYAKLDEMKSEQEDKQKTLQELSDKKQSDLAEIEANKSNNVSAVGSLEMQLEDQQAILDAIAEQESRQAAEAASRAAAESQSKAEAARVAAAAASQEAAEYASRQAALAAAQAAAAQQTTAYVAPTQAPTQAATQAATEAATQSDTGSIGDDTPSSSTGSYIWPLPSAYHRISTEFGVSDAFGRAGHCGVDYPAPSGTPIYAVAGGTVTMSCYTAGTGNCVKIDHGNGLSSIYMHLSAFNCSAGQSVSQGQVIGYVGTTGPSTGNHLHISFQLNGVWVNPHTYIGY